MAKACTLDYLIFWYLGGTAVILFAAMESLGSIEAADLGIGAALGILSGTGQNFIGMALATGLPGNVMFPSPWRPVSSS